MLDQPQAFTPATRTHEQQLELFARVLSGLSTESFVQNGSPILIVEPGSVREALTRLRDDDEAALDILSFVSAVDYSPRQPRFDVVYQLYSIQQRHRCRVKARLTDTESETVLPQIDSVADIYLAANWHERECYDLFGIHFAGHPDLRRIVLPDRWDGHPLRRDYPFDGKRVWKLGTTLVDAVEADVNLGL